MPPRTWGQNLAWRIDYTDTARTKLRRLDRDTARRIINYMDERVAVLRGGLVCLNSAARFDKWNRAAVR